MKKNYIGLISGMIASVFGGFNYIAMRRIGKQVHSSIKTVYLGIVSTLFCFLILIFFWPSYFKFWTIEDYLSWQQLKHVVLVAVLFYLSIESLSTALENLRAGTVACFSYLSILVYHFGYEFQELLSNKHYLSHGKALKLAQIARNEKTQSKALEYLGLILALGFITVLFMLTMIEQEQEFVVA